MTFKHALELLPSIMTEADVIAVFGPPHGEYTFDPQDPDDPKFRYETRDMWLGRYGANRVFLPPNIPTQLPVRTKVVLNKFDPHIALAGDGELDAYIDEYGQVLG